MKDLEKILEKYSIEVEDTGNFYEVTFIDKGAKKKLHVAVKGKILNFDGLSLINGKRVELMSKQDLANTYIELINSLQ